MDRDRKGRVHHHLPVPERDRSQLGSPQVAPRSPLEALLTEIWAEEAPTIAGLAEHVEANRSAERRRAVPIPVTRAGRAPLSFSQQRLFVLNRLAPNSAAYNVPVCWRLEGQLRPEILRRSLSEIVRRHAVLRSTFGGPEEPVQRVEAAALLPLPRVDLRSLPAAAREEAARRCGAAEARRLFDLERGPVLRAVLVRLEEEVWHLVVTMHQIVSDAYSIEVLWSELAVLYKAFADGRACPLPELEIQYGDYADWQRRGLGDEEVEELLEYWKSRLQGPSLVLELPADRPRPAVKSFHGDLRPVVLPPRLVEGLRSSGRQQRATLFMTLLAGFATVLHRYSGQSEIRIGVPVDHRGRVELERLIGCFVNTLVFNIRMDVLQSVESLLKRMKETVLEAYAYSDLPFGRLVEELEPERSLSHSPLFQAMFVFEKATRPPPLASVRAREEYVEVGTAEFDLTLHLRETPEGLAAALRYSTDLFDGVTVERLGKHWRALLEGFVADRSQRVSALPLWSAGERHQLLTEWNDTGRGAPEPCCVHELFEAWVDRTPHAPALVFEDIELTYRELDRLANRLAFELRGVGVRQEVRVAICAARGVEMVVGILGVLKAGGAYVPLDPAVPSQRLLSTLADSAARVLVTHRALAGVLAESPLPRIVLDGVESGYGDERPSSGVRPGNLAYVIYTSGSTGRPKGVAIEHRQLLNYVRGVASRLDLSPGASFATVSTLAADLGNTAIFSALAGGGPLHVISSGRLADPEGMAQYVERHALDGLKIVPGHLEALLTCARPGRVLPRKLVLGGEAFPRALFERLRELEPECEIFNHYGPTEATVGVLTHRVGKPPRSATVPIGRPLPNVEAYLLDADLRSVGLGIAGELGLGGRNLARGYLGRPGLTAERFVPSPCGSRPGDRLYRTGDRARAAGDGAIEFLGRIDQQVKIRGYRIEPEEVANLLRHHPGVREAFVGTTTVLGELDLVAYFVSGPATAPTAGTLSSALAARLPAYMVPRFFVELDAIPLTPNGKVDRRRLPVPEKPVARAPARAPSTELERALTKIWSEVLELDSVSLEGNFFELGGHSLKGMMICSRIRDLFTVEVPLRNLFESPTITELSVVVEEAISKSAAPGSELRPQVIRRVARRRVAVDPDS